MPKPEFLDGVPLASVLSWCAEQLEKHDTILWDAVCRALTKGNRNWSKDIVGHSASEMAIKEIERLYAIEATLKIRSTPSGGENA